MSCPRPDAHSVGRTAVPTNSARRSANFRPIPEGVGVKNLKKWRPAIALVLTAGCAGGFAVASGTAYAAGPPRVELNVLVVTDGTPWVDGIRRQMASEGVATTVVDLND